MSVRRLVAPAGLFGLALLMVFGGGFGAAGLTGLTATGSTSGGPVPPPHPNV